MIYFLLDFQIQRVFLKQFYEFKSFKKVSFSKFQLKRHRHQPESPIELQHFSNLIGIHYHMRSIKFLVLIDFNISELTGYFFLNSNILNIDNFGIESIKKFVNI